MRLWVPTPPIVLCSLVAMYLPSCSTEHHEAVLPHSSSEQYRITQQTFFYECSGTRNIPVTVNDDGAWLVLPEKTIYLPLVRSGSGAKYSDGTNIFWSKGEEAYFQTETGELSDCRNNRQLAVWEHAKRTGVDFRAAGNEPGWNLELRADRIEFTGDYGAIYQTFPRSEPENDTEKQQTIYRVYNGTAQMTILLKAKECFDTMSGESFETTVIIRQEGNRLQGCGTALQ